MTNYQGNITFNFTVDSSDPAQAADRIVEELALMCTTEVDDLTIVSTGWVNTTETPQTEGAKDG